MADEYTTDINENPDYQLVMTFLKNINPGDMDCKAAYDDWPTHPRWWRT